MKDFKKILAIFLALAMCFAFCACGDDEETQEEETATTDYSKYADFDFSAGIDENGFWEGIKATDYVTLPSLDKLVVSQEDLDEKIESVMGSEDYMKQVANTSADRIIEDGDTVNIDYVGSIDGVEFDGGSTEGAGTDVTIGVTSYIDDFLEQLIGHHPGETINVEVTFPDDYGNEDLNGKDALFVTTINSVTDYERNELTDSFVFEYFADSTGWKTVEEFKQGCAGAIAEDNLYRESTYADELPEVIGDAYVGSQMANLYLDAQQYGLDLDTYISYAFSSYGITTAAQVESAYEAYATVVTKQYLLYQAVAETVNITVDDSDLELFYSNNGITDDNKETVLEVYGEPYFKAMELYTKASLYIESVTVVE